MKKILGALLTVAVAVSLMVVPAAGSGDELLQKYEATDKVFERYEIGDKIVYFHQRMIDAAVVEGDYIVYQFDKNTEELLDKKTHWRGDLAEHLPPAAITITKERAESIVTGEKQSSKLYIISPESDVFPLKVAPENPCWVVTSVDAGSMNVTIIDAVNGEVLGYGIPPPYKGFSLSGPVESNPCQGTWASWYENAEWWFNTMGYPTEAVVYPDENKVRSHIQSTETAMFYEVAHGDSTGFASGCTDGTDYEITYASEIHDWMEGYTKMPFTFIGSCHGMCEVGAGTHSYEFTKGSSDDTVTIGYCHMEAEACSDCWDYSVRWQDALFNYMSQGQTVKQAFDNAMADFPVCLDCMRFAGDEDFAVVPTVTRTTPPVVESFNVYPDCVTIGGEFTIAYDVSDTGGFGLKQTELWRAIDVDGVPDWGVYPIDNPKNVTPLSGQTSYSGSFSDAPPSVGSYWYGLHVVDNAGEWNDEQNSKTGGVPGDFGPIQVEVTPIPLPDPPTLVSPGTASPPGEIIDTLTPTFQWESVSNADYYGLYISEYPYGSEHLIFESDVHYGPLYGTSFELPSGYLELGKRYRWDMNSYNNSVGWGSVSPELYFQTYTPPSLSLTPSSQNFGNVQTGECSSNYSFTLQNMGGGTANGTVFVTGSDAGQFTITGGGGSFSLGAGATKIVKVKFCPDSEGSKSATLYADGTNCNDDTSSLSGTGVAASQNGSLTVSIYPAEVRGEARWRLTSGPDTGWKQHGEMISNIPTGSYTLQFKDVTGWNKPSDKPITINPGANSESGTYIPILDWHSPSATGKAYYEWTNPTNAFSSDDQYATAQGTYLEQDYYNFNFNTPSNAVINGIELAIEGHGDGVGNYIKAEIYSASEGYWEGNDGWMVLGDNGEDALATYGGPSELWGLSWLPSDFSNDDFQMMITTFSRSDKLYVDHIQVKVYYTEVSIQPPQVTTNSATNEEETTATLNGVITDDGGEACQYRFEYDTNSGEPYAYNTGWTGSKTSGQSFSAPISSLAKGTKYYFRAQGRNSADTTSGSELTLLTKPDAPTSFDATTVGTTQIDLSWVKGAGAQKTKIQRKQGSYPTNRDDGTQVYFDTGSSEPNTGLAPGTTYYYGAWSYVQGSEQWSDNCAQASATTASLCPVRLESSQDNTATSNKGNITFDGVNYSLPEDISIAQGNYSATYSPESGYEFKNWSTEGNVSVLAPDSQATTVTVSCGGTLRAIYKQKLQSSVSFDPSESHIYVGSTTTVNITLDTTPDGLSGCNLTVSLSNATIAEIVSVSFPSWATLHDNSALPADSVWMKSADLTDQIKSGATNITLGTLTIRGDNEGTSDVTITVTKMDDDDGNPINPNKISGQIEVIGVVPLPGYTIPPTDPDGDGLFEDINGNGSLDFNDVVVFFKNLEWVEDNEPIDCFDFNGNGNIDFDDIVKLFNEV